MKFASTFAATLLLGSGAALADPWYDCENLDNALLLNERCTEALELGREEGMSEFEPGLLLTRGLARAELGDVAGARSDLLAASAFQSGDAFVLDQIAQALLFVGDAGNAYSLAQTAVGLGSGDGFFANTLGLAQCRLGRDQDAFDTFSAAAPGAGQSVGWVQMAWVAEAGLYDGALTSWQAAPVADWIAHLCP